MEYMNLYCNYNYLYIVTYILYMSMPDLKINILKKLV